MIQYKFLLLAQVVPLVHKFQLPAPKVIAELAIVIMAVVERGKHQYLVIEFLALMVSGVGIVFTHAIHHGEMPAYLG